MELFKILIVKFFVLNVLVYGNDIQCPAIDGPDPVYFPHETDCGKFYECSNGVPYLFECPADLYFNPELNVCDYPDQAGCIGRTTEGPTEVVTTLNPSVSTADTSEEPTELPTLSSSRPSKPSKPTRPSKPTKPNRPPRPTKPSRPPRPTKPSRPSRPSRPPPPDNSSEESNENSDSESNESDSSDDSSDSNEDDADTNLRILLGISDSFEGFRCNFHAGLLETYPNDCTKYINCYQGFTTVRSCSKQYNFDSDIRICVPPGYVKCGAI